MEHAIKPIRKRAHKHTGDIFKDSDINPALSRSVYFGFVSLKYFVEN